MSDGVPDGMRYMLKNCDWKVYPEEAKSPKEKKLMLKFLIRHEKMEIKDAMKKIKQYEKEIKKLSK